MDTPDNGINGSFTLKVVQHGDGMLVSLASEGHYSDEMFTRKFYSIGELPPPDVTPAQFWAAIMDDVQKFLRAPG